jgi:conjugal transfer pilus assembly protein TraA
MGNLKERWADPKSRKKLILQILVILVVCLVAVHAFAGSDSTFDVVVQWLIGVLNGSGGKMLALLGIAIALISAVARGSLGGVLLGLGITLTAIYGPTILTGMFTAIF